ncbi:MAG: carbohydrate binding domain-containing protein [Clostridia bacterium]|nr:carbohydrate binding domain-containing protein [Clostridia bacterium]
MNKITLYPDKKLHPLGDLYGIFFEDINHAADGGLYAEMVQNRSFEFDTIDNRRYNPLTAWETLGCEVRVENAYPLNRNNTHYLVIEVNDYECGVENHGFNDGMHIKKGERYKFSFYARRNTGFSKDVNIRLVSKETGPVACETIKITSCDWEKYQCVLTAEESGVCYLVITTSGKSLVYLDDVSLFPENTYKNRENGLRRDIATLLAELKPKFMRFPGGCLVHDGNLDPHARNSLYRWKNTIGDVSERPTRRSNWGYNQTLGLGYYEYFLFCEDIGAKPLPVLPAAYNPHHHDAVPFDELKPWIDDALDLIEFANGTTETKWGKIRAELGHSEPFNLEYLAIGNEEVGDDFFERYPYFHKAIKEKYPEIKLIGSSGPFPCGGEFEKGWKCARENKSEMVDEHYYVSPEWMIANNKRYFEYKKDDPKVFLGEYASWGNTFYNALCEASYMTAMETSGNVALACYAPLLCNADYVNWKPDLIWFNGESAYGTPNYYVQKLFMNNQGDSAIEHSVVSEKNSVALSDENITGEIFFKTVDTEAQFYDIKINGKTVNEKGFTLKREGSQMKKLEEVGILGDFELECKAKELDGKRGFIICFGVKGYGNLYHWEFGGWQNQDSAVCSTVNYRESVLAHELRSVEKDREYTLKVVVRKNVILCYIDNELVHEAVVKPAVVEPVYTASSVNEDGSVVLKVVNLQDTEYNAEIETNMNIQRVAGEVITGDLNAENSFENPKNIVPCNIAFEYEGSVIKHSFPSHSVTVIVING